MEEPPSREGGEVWWEILRGIALMVLWIVLSRCGDILSEQLAACHVVHSRHYWNCLSVLPEVVGQICQVCGGLQRHF
jgi:hypothetical protein